MNIIVCVKQVPNVAAIKFDREAKTIVREGVPLQLNSLDRRALTQALDLRDQLGGKVTVISLGPPQAKSALIESLATGADEAILISDRAFAGSDTLATARALAAAIRKLPYDVVFCGRFSVDAETGQVGPEVAELLDLPHATNLFRLTAEGDGTRLTATREVEEGFEILEVQTPCLLTAGEFLVTPRRPTPDEIEQFEDHPVAVWTAADLGLAADQIGAAGSPTTVSEIQEFVVQREQRVVHQDDPDAAAKLIMDYLVAKGLSQPWERSVAATPARRTGGALRSDRAVWVVADHALGQLRHVTLELLGKGVELAHQLNGELIAVLIGNDVSGLADTLAAYGADRVYLAEDPTLAHYNSAAYSHVLSEAITHYKPYVVLLGATINGRDLAPRVAARLQLGLTGDAIDLEIDAQEQLVQLKPAFGGSIVAPIISRTVPAIATVRPGMLASLAPQPEQRAVVENLNLTLSKDDRVRLLEFQPTVGTPGLELDNAEVVVGVGMGVGSADNVPPFQALAAAFDGALATTLPAVRGKVLPSQLQVGLTGRSIAPRFYLAFAISGALNHLIGIQRTETIVAVNKDPEAAIFKSCDFGIVGDYATIVPALTKLANEAKPTLAVRSTH